MLKSLKFFLEKHDLLKKKNFDLKVEMKDLCSSFESILQEKEEITCERDSLKSQLDLALKENEFLKSKNDCNDVLKTMKFYLQN